MTAAPLTTAAITPNRRLGAYGIDGIPVTTGEVLGATFEDAWTRNPGPSLWRWAQRELTVSTERYLTQDQANRDFGIAGELSFDGPVPPHVARDLHTLKRAELQRRSIMQRGEGGFGESAAQLGVGFAAGLLDPLNIATAFVPVVGQARYGAMLANAAGAGGRTAVRLGVGAVEGAAGAALVEPLVYGVARQEQADYGAVDSLLNLAFGTVLGGGLHTIGGAVGDMVAPGRWRAPGEVRVDGLPVERQQEALNLSVAAVADGRPVDGVEAVIAAEQAALRQRRNDIRDEVADLRADPSLPPGPAGEVLAVLTPETLSDIVEVRRGPAFRDKSTGELSIPRKGAEGLIKLEIKHPEVTDDELLLLPRVLREQQPHVFVSKGETNVWEWRRHQNGAELVFRLKKRTIKEKDDGRLYLLTIFRREDPSTFRGETPYLSAPAGVVPSGSTGRLVQDTPQPLSVRASGGHSRPAPRNMGRRGLQSNLGEVYDTAGRRLDVRYEVVEADSLTVSHTDDLAENPRYPQELQPRDRTRAASGDQLRHIVARFEPALLTRSRDAATGAPIVGPDGVVESGNGRTLALRRIHREHPDQANRYRAQLVRDGFAIDGYREPVLIARRLTDLSPEERRQFTVDAQKAATLDLSPSERARVDARLLDGILHQYRDGDPFSIANADFRRAFVDQLPQGDRGALLNAGGHFSPQGVARLRNALLARAFDDFDLIETMLEHMDDTSRALSGALFDVAPAWARMRASVAAGEISPHVDATADLLDAVRMIRDARAAGRPLDHLLSQVDAFRRPSPATDLFLSQMLRGKTTAGRYSIVANLTRYVDEAMKSAPEADIFGAAPPTAGELLRSLSRTDPTRAAPDDAAALDRIAATIAALPERPATPDTVTAQMDGLDARLAGMKERIGDAPELAEAEALLKEADGQDRAFDAGAACLLKGGLA